MKYAREAAAYFGDAPVDYKGRTVTGQGLEDTARSPHYPILIEAVRKQLPSGHLLDVGIAYGIYAVLLQRQFGYRITGLEHPENAAAYCRYPVAAGIPVATADLHYEQLPFPVACFDGIIAAEVVEHLFISPTGLFRRLGRVIRPGGKIIITTPNFSNIRNICTLARGLNPSGCFPDEWPQGVSVSDRRTHPREYTWREISEALHNAGFREIRVKTSQPWSPSGQRPLAMLLDRLARKIPLTGSQLLAVATWPGNPPSRGRGTP